MSFRRAFSTSASKLRRAHADFYSSLLPAMIPVALLGSAVYMVSPGDGLHLVQSRLAHEKFLDEANERIRALEQQLDSLQGQHSAVATSHQVSSPQKSSSWSWF